MQTYNITICRSWDLAIRKTELGKQLYSKWREARKQRCDQAFHAFPTFFLWAIASGYRPGAYLVRLDAKSPYSPLNCEWKTPAAYVREAENWDKTVAEFKRRLAAAEGRYSNHLKGERMMK